MVSWSIPSRKLRRKRSSLNMFAAALVLAEASVASAAERSSYASDSTVDSIVDNDEANQIKVLHEE